MQPKLKFELKCYLLYILKEPFVTQFSFPSLKILGWAGVFVSILVFKSILFFLIFIGLETFLYLYSEWRSRKYLYWYRVHHSKEYREYKEALRKIREEKRQQSNPKTPTIKPKNSSNQTSKLQQITHSSVDKTPTIKPKNSNNQTQKLQQSNLKTPTDNKKQINLSIFWLNTLFLILFFSNFVSAELNTTKTKIYVEKLPTCKANDTLLIFREVINASEIEKYINEVKALYNNCSLDYQKGANCGMAWIDLANANGRLADKNDKLLEELGRYKESHKTLIFFIIVLTIIIIFKIIQELFKKEKNG